MLLVASETGHVYTFATRKLQPMITSDSGKALIQTCLNSPDVIPSSSPTSSVRHVTSSSPARSEYADSSPQSTSPHGDQAPLPEVSQRRQRNMVTSSTGAAEEADYSCPLTSSSSDAKVCWRITLLWQEWLHFEHNMGHTNWLACSLSNKVYFGEQMAKRK